MDQWLKDREEIIKHWGRVSFCWKVIILFFFLIMDKQIVESIVYLLNRLYVRPDRMVKIYSIQIDNNRTDKWDHIYTYLRSKLWNK